jgi:hypothetical protein
MTIIIFGLGLIDGDALGCATELEVLSTTERAWLAIFESQHKESSARWKSIEAALTRFCAEHHLTTAKLLAARPMPRAIDEARKLSMPMSRPIPRRKSRCMNSSVTSCLASMATRRDNQSTRSLARCGDPKITKQFRRPGGVS